MTTAFARHFAAKTRTKTGINNGDEIFITLADDAPPWLKEAVREAHQDTLPSDWIYAECQAATLAFDEGSLDDSEDDDCVHEHTDSRIDTATKDLYQWAADFCLTDTFAAAEEEATDMGMLEEKETVKRIMSVQYAAIRYIADTMRQACIAAVKEGYS
jgi:hypothetical protein